VRAILDYDISVPAATATSSFKLFQSLLVRHSVQRSPDGEGIMSPAQAKLFNEFVAGSYHRHYKLYNYVFTKRQHVSFEQKHSNLVEDTMATKAMGEAFCVNIQTPDIQVAGSQSGGDDRVEGESQEQADDAEAEAAPLATPAAAPAAAADGGAPPEGDWVIVADEHAKAPVPHVVVATAAAPGADADALRQQMDDDDAAAAAGGGGSPHSPWRTPNVGQGVYDGSVTLSQQPEESLRWAREGAPGQEAEEGEGFCTSRSEGAAPQQQQQQQQQLATIGAGGTMVPRPPPPSGDARSRALSARGTGRAQRFTAAPSSPSRSALSVPAAAGSGAASGALSLSGVAGNAARSANPNAPPTGVGGEGVCWQFKSYNAWVCHDPGMSGQIEVAFAAGAETLELLDHNQNPYRRVRFADMSQVTQPAGRALQLRRCAPCACYRVERGMRRSERAHAEAAAQAVMAGAHARKFADEAVEWHFISRIRRAEQSCNMKMKVGATKRGQVP
jgi:hypothetical protein